MFRSWYEMEMQFLSDLQIPCSHCEGKRFRANLQIKLNGLSVFEFGLTIEEAAETFGNYPRPKERWRLSNRSVSSCLTLGQPLNTLSGGDLNRQLVNIDDAEKGSLPSLLLVDEPTTGCTWTGVDKLLACLKSSKRHSLLVVEHNRQVLNEADWIIELGPSAGKKGGRIIAEGTRIAHETIGHGQSHEGLPSGQSTAKKWRDTGEP